MEVFHQNYICFRQIWNIDANGNYIIEIKGTKIIIVVLIDMDNVSIVLNVSVYSINISDNYDLKISDIIL